MANDPSFEVLRLARGVSLAQRVPASLSREGPAADDSGYDMFRVLALSILRRDSEVLGCIILPASLQQRVCLCVLHTVQHR